VVSLDGLPTGTVTISGAAFDRSCAAVAGTSPTWTADPVSATLSTGASTSQVGDNTTITRLVPTAPLF
jgi:hypothetical protein